MGLNDFNLIFLAILYSQVVMEYKGDVEGDPIIKVSYICMVIYLIMFSDYG